MAIIEYALSMIYPHDETTSNAEHYESALWM